MAINYMSPGVYLYEADYSQYTQDSSSCVIAMVGAARRGPVNVPTLITTQEQMIQTFGEPVEGEYGVYSALQALTQANRLYYVRVVRSGVKASAGIIGTDKVIYKAKAEGEDYNGIKIEQTALNDDTETFDITVKSSKDAVLETYTDLSIKGVDTNYVESVINAQSNYITADVQSSGSVIEKTFVLGETEDTKGLGGGSYARAGSEETDKLVFRSKYFDSDLNGCVVVITDQDKYGYFDITVKDSDNSVIEAWSNMNLDKNSEHYVETLINKRSDRIIVTVNENDDIQFEGKTLAFSGGDDAISGISSYDIIGETSGGGLNAFSNPEVISIDILTAPGWTDPSVLEAAIGIAEKRADCIFIADTPFGLSAQEVTDFANGTGSYTNKGFDSSYAAFYWPWLKYSDSYTRRDIWLPPSGFVAAQYAYNDSVAYPWNAPAGLERGMIHNAIGVEVSPTQGERDMVYGNRNIVNPIVNFISNGIVIWGQKTAQREPTALDRVNVRRLLNYLKRSIGTVTKSFVFEQNIQATWERWKTAVTPILENCKISGGVYEYKTVIQPTASDIENNRMPINVYIKPTKTAEFIPLTFNIMSYSASFDNL